MRLVRRSVLIKESAEFATCPWKRFGVLMRRATRGGYALGYFESWNLESLQGVIDAAEQTRSPIIIGFNGDFLSSPDRLARETLAWYAALGRAAAASASVPCGLIFNECPRDDWVRQAITSGFNLVMPADPDAPFDRLRRPRRRADPSRPCARRRRRGRARRAALRASRDMGSAAGHSTDPALAAEFVATTGIDLLAVSVGNVHVKLDGTQALDLGRLEQIRRPRHASPGPSRRNRDLRRLAPPGHRPGGGQGQLRNLSQAALPAGRP